MSKFIKHEFAATARYMLPVYGVLLVSGILIAVLKDTSGIFSRFTGFFVLAFLLSFFAVGVLCLFILISRFYSNVMTDRAYLTMTLPMTVHEFIWAELIVSVAWVLISAFAIAAIGAICLSAANINIFSGLFSGYGGIFGAINRAIGGGVVGRGFPVIFTIECIIGISALLLCWCLRFYLSMACGQMAANHKKLISVAVYLLIGILLSGITTRGMSAISELNCRYFYQCVELAGAYIDVVALAVAAVMYFFTALILKKRLNLQ